MNLRRTLTWVGVAALGLGLTTAVTITTTLLSQQPIALASEPLSAGNTLVPQTAKPTTAADTIVPPRAAKVRHRVVLRHKKVELASPKTTPPAVEPATSAPSVLVTPTTPQTTTAAAPTRIGNAPTRAATTTVVAPPKSVGDSGKDGGDRKGQDLRSDQSEGDD